MKVEPEENKEKSASEESAASRRPPQGGGLAQSQAEWIGDNPYVNYSAHLFTDPWEKSSEEDGKQGKPLYKSLGGRVSTRLLSRGVFGATFMTLGNMAVRTWDPHMPIDEMRTLHKGMSYLAHGIDVAIGSPIKSMFGEEAVTFRTKKNFSATRNREAIAKTLAGDRVPVEFVNGRSLGQEVVGVTLDFAAGSFGDALGRELVAVADPNYHKDWLKNGHVNFGELAKSAGKSLWRIMSYNQMEDWAAALPYVYQMKAQRKIIGKAWHGSKFTLDHQNNGGSFLVDSEGNIQGSLMAAGALDLQARFMGYNFYTLMFRDTYNHVAMKLGEWKDNGFHVNASLPEHPIRSMEHGAEETAKYVAKSFMKSMLYMAPAVPFFWAFRTPISRNSGVFVAEKTKGGVVVTENTLELTPPDKHGMRYLQAEELPSGEKRTSSLSEHLFTVADTASSNWVDGVLHKNGRPVELFLQSRKIEPDYLKPGFDPYDKKYCFGAFDKALNPFGKIARTTSQVLDKHLFRPIVESSVFKGYMAKVPYLTRLANDYPQVLNRYNLTNTYVNAAISYTPYMIAKYETANHIDMPLFDAAAYRFLDGVDTLKWKDMKEGVHDMASLIVRGPISEGTIAASHQARGLVNSSFESAFRDNKHQHELKMARKADREAREKEEMLRKSGGWVAYETARAQTQEKGAPDGVTIH